MALAIGRKIGESVTIGTNIVVRVVSVRGDKVRLAIEAPHEVTILRTELLSKGDAA